MRCPKTYRRRSVLRQSLELRGTECPQSCCSCTESGSALGPALKLKTRFTDVAEAVDEDTIWNSSLWRRVLYAMRTTPSPEHPRISWHRVLRGCSSDTSACPAG